MRPTTSFSGLGSLAAEERVGHKNMNFCEKAIAYIRPDLSGEKTKADIDLTHEDSPILRDLNNGLLVAYLVDLEDQFNYVQYRHLKQENISENDIHKIGISNLGKLSKEKLDIRNQGSFYSVFLDGNFEASLILIDGLWDQGIRKLYKDNIVVCLPARDILAFCDSSSENGINELKLIIEKVWDGGDHLLTRSLYIRSNSKWEAMNAQQSVPPDRRGRAV